MTVNGNKNWSYPLPILHIIMKVHLQIVSICNTNTKFANKIGARARKKCFSQIALSSGAGRPGVVKTFSKDFTKVLSGLTFFLKMLEI